MSDQPLPSVAPQPSIEAAIPPLPRSAAGRWTLRVAGLLLAAAGWWLSVDLTQLSGGGRASNPWLQSQCGGPEARNAGDCLSVLASKHAYLTLPGGRQEQDEAPATQPATSQPAPVAEGPRIPWSVIGSAYFAFVFCWFLFVGPPVGNGRWWYAILLIVLIVGAFHSASFTHTMAVVLKRWCVGCVAAHVVNFGLLGVGLLGLLTRRRIPGEPSHPRAALAGATLLAGVMFGMFLITYAALGGMSDRARDATKLWMTIVRDPDYPVLAGRQFVRQPIVNLPARAPEYSIGQPTAPNVIVAFIDFQCPSCKQFADVLDQVLDKSPDKVRADLRHFPHDRSCNPHHRGGHPAACAAARAAEAARKVGGSAAFAKMKDLMYKRQAELEEADFVRWAVECGLDAQRFEAELKSEAVAQQVREDIELGNSLGVRSIPAPFFNGRKVDYWSNPSFWEILIKLPPQAFQQPTTRPAAPAGPAPRP
jgi:protein-disulfide isomerase